MSLHLEVIKLFTYPTLASTEKIFLLPKIFFFYAPRPCRSPTPAPSPPFSNPSFAFPFVFPPFRLPPFAMFSPPHAYAEPANPPSLVLLPPPPGDPTKQLRKPARALVQV